MSKGSRQLFPAYMDAYKDIGHLSMFFFLLPFVGLSSFVLFYFVLNATILFLFRLVYFCRNNSKALANFLSVRKYIRKWQILALPPVFDSFVTPRSNQWLIKRNTKCQLTFSFPRCSPFLHSHPPFLFWTFASSVGHERSPFVVRLFFFLSSPLGEREKIDALFRKSCDKQFSQLTKSDNDRKIETLKVDERRLCVYSFWLIWHTNYSSSICSDTIVNSL